MKESDPCIDLLLDYYNDCLRALAVQPEIPAEISEDIRLALESMAAGERRGELEWLKGHLEAYLSTLVEAQGVLEKASRISKK